MLFIIMIIIVIPLLVIGQTITSYKMKKFNGNQISRNVICYKLNNRFHIYNIKSGRKTPPFISIYAAIKHYESNKQIYDFVGKEETNG